MGAFLSHAALAQSTVATVPTGTTPYAAAVNPVTGKAYIANQGTNTVTIIDGANFSATNVVTGAGPLAIAINPISNRVYVLNRSASSTLSVLDGSSNAVLANISIGAGGSSVAVNPVTNRVYVALTVPNTVQVIDGGTNTTVTSVALPAGTGPFAVAVNPVTNRIYTANFNNNTFSVINGATNAVITTAAAGTQPVSVAVDPVNDKVFIANYQGSSVTVVNGANNTTSTVATGSGPRAIGVNPATGKVYVANSFAGTVTVIDSVSLATATVTAGSGANAVSIDVLLNRIWVANESAANVTMIEGSDNSALNVAVGTNPRSVAVNPVTHRVFVANSASANATVIDGQSRDIGYVTLDSAPVTSALNPLMGLLYVANYGSNNVSVVNTGNDQVVATIPTGLSPRGVAVNPVTNKIYVANFNSSSVTVIDGASNSTSTFAAQANPWDIAVNPLNGKVYVSNFGNNTVTIHNSYTGVTSHVGVGAQPRMVLVNPATGRAFVANNGQSTVSMIDGTTDLVSFDITTGARPVAMALNPVTNRIYVACESGNVVTMIEDGTFTTQNIAVGARPLSVAVNPATNRIYAANYTAVNVSVINGATNTVVATLPATHTPFHVDVNPFSNRIYVANLGDGSTHVVTEINGFNNAVTTLNTSGVFPYHVTVDPVSGKAYVASNGGPNHLMVIKPDGAAAQFGFHRTAISTSGGGITTMGTPSLTFTPCCDYAPGNAAVRATHWRLSDHEGPFIAAAGGGPFSANVGLPLFGLYIVSAFATDGFGGSSFSTSSNGAGGTTAVIGAPARYALYRVSALSITTVPLTAATGGTPYSRIIAATGGAGARAFTMSGSVPPGLTINAQGLLSGTPTLAGTYNFNINVSDATGSASASFSLVVNAVAPGAPTITSVTGGDRQVTVNFTAPASEGGSPITTYTIRNVNTGTLTLCNVPCSAATVPGLVNGISYRFEVRATNSVGPGPYSAQSALVTPSTVPATPTINAVIPGNGRVTLTFTLANSGGAPITQFIVTRTPDGVATLSVPGSPAVFTGLANGTPYTFTVRAININGSSASSASSAATIPFGPPGAPTNAIAVPLNASAQVSYTPPADNGGAPISSYTAIASPGGQQASGNVNPLTVTGLTNGVSYTFTVRANNPAGGGAPSSPSNAVTPFVPAPPAITSALPPSGTLGQSYGHTMAATGAPAPTFSVFSGALPPGLALNPASGLIDGTPTAGGTFNGILRASNGVGTADQSFNIAIALINQAITFGAPPMIRQGETGTLSATGGGSMNPVVFTTNTPSICSVSGSTVTGLAQGLCTIAANQAGNASYNPAPEITQAFMIDPPAITFTGNVFSRKVHGNGVGVIDLPLADQPVTGAYTVEPRNSQGGHSIVFRFSSTVTAVGAISVSDVEPPATIGIASSFDGNDLIVTLLDVADGTRLTVNVAGVNNALNTSRTVGFLTGDLNASKAVNAADIAAVKARSGAMDSLANALADIDLNGVINHIDISAAKARAGRTLP
jgi:YVTN family beta-propeller protein